MTNSAVRMAGVVKRFPGVVANDGVNFEVLKGEIHALLGENGAGKSTLSNILTGLYRPDEGTIELNGAPVSFASPKAALALVERATDLVGAAVGIDDLLTMTEAYEERLTELVDEDDATAEYVTQLEEEFDSQQFDDELRLASGDGLVEEVERYLREQ